MPNIEKVQQIIGYQFKDINLLVSALTRQSYANEYDCVSYEKQEFLGDAVINCVVCDYLYKNHSNLNVGEYSQIKSTAVSENSLSRIYSKLDLQPFIRLGKSELANSTIITKAGCDVIEAIIGAIYLDGGYISAYAVTKTLLAGEIDRLVLSGNYIDNVTLIKNYCDKHSYKYSFETISETGPDHMKIFEVALIINSNQMSIGSGFSLSDAKQQAAKIAYRMLSELD